jgi:hypothetical protein
MANNTVNTLKNAPGAISKMAAQMIENKVQFSKTIDMEPSSSWRGRDGYETGNAIQISKPARFTVGTNADITAAIQSVTEEKVALTLDIRKVIAVDFTSAEIATDLAMADWTKRVLDPAISRLAQAVEQEHISRAVLATANLVGTAGSTVFDNDTILAAGQKINENACPDLDSRYVLLNPAAQRSAVNTRKGLFQKSDNIASQYIKGVMGTSDGFDFLSNNLLPIVTNGNDVTGVQVDTNVVEGSSTLIMKGLTANTGTVTAGSNFTITGVNAVDPITKQDLGFAQQFTVVTGGTADGNGDLSTTVTPAFYTSTSVGLQNITTLPVVDMPLVFSGLASTGYVQNLAYHKSAYRMASVPLILPNGTNMSSQSTSDGGFTIRVIQDYLPLTDKMVMRFDYLGGFAPVRPEWGVRVTA